MGYKLGYHILVLPHQVLLINSVLLLTRFYCIVILESEELLVAVQDVVGSTMGIYIKEL